LSGNDIAVTNGPFISAAWVITCVQGNIITIPARGTARGRASDPPARHRCV